MSLEKTPGAATAEEGVSQGSFQARERAVYGVQAARRSVQRREGWEMRKRCQGRYSELGEGQTGVEWGVRRTRSIKMRSDYRVSRLPIHRTLRELALGRLLHFYSTDSRDALVFSICQCNEQRNAFRK